MSDKFGTAPIRLRRKSQNDVFDDFQNICLLDGFERYMPAGETMSVN